MALKSTWHGTEAEAVRLAEVVARNCECTSTGNDARMCSSHSMLDDQRILDGMLFARTILQQLRAEENCKPQRAPVSTR